jgi:UDP-N-acetylmuramoyl-L-alanyl-D-glutamate--2,6-diaminopimelate ligase
MSQLAFAARTAGMRLDDIARQLPMVVRIVGDASVRVKGVRHDSRTVQPGDLFVARRGLHVDAARFTGDAIARGAAAVMVGDGGLAQFSGDERVPVLLVDDPVSALAHVSALVYEQPSLSLEVVGITGTNGKTTTAHLVRAAVDGALGRPCCGIVGTIGQSFGTWHARAEHTTPEADDLARTMATMRKLGATHLAMEVSSHALALGRVRGIGFRVAALTNLTQDHLDFHGSMAAYAEAKGRLFLDLAPGAVVLNVDDPFGAELARRVTAPVVRVSVRPDPTGQAEIAPLQVRIDSGGIEASLRTPSGVATIASRLFGAHNLDNLLLALGIAHALGLDVSRVADALSRVTAPPGRLERCDGLGDVISVLVDYAHTPDALARALDAVRATTRGRVWCVFGCGGDRDPTKRAPMGEVVARRADVTIVTSDNPRTEDPLAIAAAVASGARRVGVDPVLEPDRRKAIDLAVRSAAAGDAVLIAGKGHEEVQIVGAARYPFSDRSEARAALERRRGQRGGA